MPDLSDAEEIFFKLEQVFLIHGNDLNCIHPIAAAI
jgi:hypothetical protein